MCILTAIRNFRGSFYTGNSMLDFHAVNCTLQWDRIGFPLRRSSRGNIGLNSWNISRSLIHRENSKSSLLRFFIGAFLAFLKMLVRRNLVQRLTYFFAYIRRLFLTKEAVPYYQASRDGKNAVIPLAVCLLGGYLWYLLRLMIK